MIISPMQKTLVGSLVAISLALQQPLASDAAPFSEEENHSTSIWQARQNDEDCESIKGPRPMRVGVRHIEGRGIGYKSGYTSLDAFFSPTANNREIWPFVPFLDLRGHYFNSNKWAANAGVGGRYLHDSWGTVLGANAYYDFRQTNHKNFNQIGLGLEALWPRWEVHANGYLPIGRKVGREYDPTFAGFSGNQLLLRYKRQVAMTGCDAEVGYNFRQLHDISFYAGIGPYFFTPRGNGKKAIGGKARLVGKFQEYVGLELSTSYDAVFRNIVQGQIFLTLPFGPRARVKKDKGGERSSCYNSFALETRLVQPVVRNEIIVLKKQKKTGIAVDPGTGEPIQFIFVDNTSNSNGTFESPYHNIVDAQNASDPGDLIYVFPGDGTSRGLDLGVALKEEQKLLKANNEHQLSTTFGSVTIPSLASIPPSIVYSEQPSGVPENVTSLLKTKTNKEIRTAIPDFINLDSMRTPHNSKPDIVETSTTLPEHNQKAANKYSYHPNEDDARNISSIETSNDTSLSSSNISSTDSDKHNIDVTSHSQKLEVNEASLSPTNVTATSTLSTSSDSKSMLDKDISSHLQTVESSETSSTQLTVPVNHQSPSENKHKSDKLTYHPNEDDARDISRPSIDLSTSGNNPASKNVDSHEHQGHNYENDEGLVFDYMYEQP